MCRGNNRQDMFHDSADHRVYYDLLFSLKKENTVKINHYCLMSNHIHLIVTVTPKSGLSRFMKQVNLGYYAHYKRKYGYTGHLMEGRYKSSIIDKDSYILQCGKYIELNPVRAGMVNVPEIYPYSSYNHYAYGKADSMISESPEYERFGKTVQERQDAYREFVLDKSVEEKIGTKKFIGGERFIKKLEEYFLVKNEGKRGRPKRTKTMITEK
jgi:putative transposase